MNNTVHTSLAVPRSNAQSDAAEAIPCIREILARHNCYGLNLEAPWLEKVFGAYQQPHRYFHTLEHLQAICRLIDRENEAGAAMTAQLLLTALFHDIVWFPQRHNNEEHSAQAFDLLRPSLGAELPEEAYQAVRSAIIATKRLQDAGEMATRFHGYDCDILLNGNPVDLLAYEFQIFREFQYMSLAEYRHGRSAFFQRFSRRYPECQANMRFLIEYLERRRPRIGIYAGSFNPFHIGHLAILQKAELMFDKVVVAVGVNPEKNAVPHKDERVEAVRKTLPFHQVVFFDSLLVDLLNQEAELADVTLVRGLRNGYDLDYETSQQCFIREMRPKTVSVYLPCNKELEHVSSSALRALANFDCHGLMERYLPHDYDYYGRTVKEEFKL